MYKQGSVGSSAAQRIEGCTILCGDDRVVCLLEQIAADRRAELTGGRNVVVV